jgi:hypothetical protein
MHRMWGLRVEEVERFWSGKLEAAAASSAAKLEEKQERWSLEHAQAEECWAQQRAEAEARWRIQLQELKQRWADEQSAADLAWSGKLEDARRAWMAERQELEEGFAKRLQEASDAAAARYEGMRRQLETRVGAISTRVAELASKESRQHAQRAELAAQLEALRNTSEDEFQRRTALERALREAAQLFKRELWDKGEEVAELRIQLHQMGHTGLKTCTHAVTAQAATAAGVSEGYTLAMGDRYGMEQRTGAVPEECSCKHQSLNRYANSSQCRADQAVEFIGEHATSCSPAAAPLLHTRIAQPDMQSEQQGLSPCKVRSLQHHVSRQSLRYSACKVSVLKWPVHVTSLQP